MENENVVQMPTLLERLASKLQTCLTQEASNRQEWIAIQEAKCATLVEIRDQFEDDDIGFGQWCIDNGFGKDVLNDDTRAACISMGRDPVALRKCLEQTKRRSLEHIYRNEFEGFRHVPKPPNRRKQEQPKSKLKPEQRMNTTPEAEAAAKAVLDEGKTYAEALAQAGLSNTVLRSAVAREEGRREAVPVAPDDMPHSMRDRYEAALRKARRELRDEIMAEISDSYQAMLDRYRQRLADADRILASHKGVMSRDAFRKIKACLHPDHNSFKFAAEALQAFSELEKVLVKPDDPVLSGPPLPRTAAELMARRRQYQR